ncbi:MAG: DUF4124 domain-containing protein [Candidatus Dactylopiibacterium sp.]|nr:DUF4124 domain-containing protein [Candidatus Dactylopiibacterium sp.]
MIRSSIRGLLVLALLGSSLPALAQVYKWVDADGSVQYGDKPPKGVKAQPISGGVTVMPAFQAPPAPVAPPAAPATIPAPPVPAAPPAPAAISAPAAVDARAAERARLIEQCLASRGSQCEEEADARLNGVPGTVYVPVPGWSRPPIRPRPPQAEPPAKPANGQKPVREAARPRPPAGKARGDAVE